MCSPASTNLWAGCIILVPFHFRSDTHFNAQQRQIHYKEPRGLSGSHGMQSAPPPNVKGQGGGNATLYNISCCSISSFSHFTCILLVWKVAASRSSRPLIKEQVATTRDCITINGYLKPSKIDWKKTGEGWYYFVAFKSSMIWAAQVWIILSGRWGSAVIEWWGRLCIRAQGQLANPIWLPAHKTPRPIQVPCCHSKWFPTPLLLPVFKVERASRTL